MLNEAICVHNKINERKAGNEGILFKMYEGICPTISILRGKQYQIKYLTHIYELFKTKIMLRFSIMKKYFKIIPKYIDISLYCIIVRNTCEIHFEQLDF
jgi:hypothetical protein